MTKEELIKKLETQKRNKDTESAHAEADNLLIEFINDEDITIAYSNVDKWYA